VGPQGTDALQVAIDRWIAAWRSAGSTCILRSHAPAILIVAPTCPRRLRSTAPCAMQKGVFWPGRASM